VALQYAFAIETLHMNGGGNDRANQNAGR
jgi:hypothetical protein